MQPTVSYAASPVRARPAAPGKAITALAALTGVNLICFYDRVQLSALLQPIKTEFGLSDTQMGLISGTAFGLTYAAATIPLGWLSDRVNRVKLLAAMLSLWSVMTGLTAVAQGFWQLMLCRVGVASGEAAFTPTAHSVLADYFPPERRGLAIGIETAGAGVGIMAGLAMAGWLASAFGWRVALLVAGLPGLAMAVFMFLRIDEPARSHTPSTSLTSARLAVPGVPLLKRVNGAYGWLVVAAVCSSIMMAGWTQWLPAFFMRTHELSLNAVGASVGVAAGIGGMAGVVAGGWLSVAIAGRGSKAAFQWCAIIVLATLPLYGLALWLPTSLLALTAVFFSLVVASMVNPFIFSALQSSCDPLFRARAVAVVLTLVTIFSYAVMPVVIGVLSDWFIRDYGKNSLKMALNAFLVMPVVASFIFFRLSRTFRAWVPPPT